MASVRTRSTTWARLEAVAGYTIFMDFEVCTVRALFCCRWYCVIVDMDVDADVALDVDAAVDIELDVSMELTSTSASQ